MALSDQRATTPLQSLKLEDLQPDATVRGILLEGAAAVLLGKLGAKAEVARELCYRLYTLFERKKRAADALAYNGLVQSWPEIARLASEGPQRRPSSWASCEVAEVPKRADRLTYESKRACRADTQGRELRC